YSLEDSSFLSPQSPLASAHPWGGREWLHTAFVASASGCRTSFAITGHSFSRCFPQLQFRDGVPLANPIFERQRGQDIPSTTEGSAAHKGLISFSGIQDHP